MAWQPEVGSGTARAVSTEDFLNKFSQFICSQHVATVAVNNGGTATYVVGDIMTLTHASAHLDARFEVTSVSAGVITGLRIIASGAFALQAASATVSAGGSGYAVGDIIEVAGGSSRLPAKFQVATLSGSAVATVTLFEGGGVYSSSPSNPAATEGVGPLAYAGDDACTLTVTYTALITPLTAVAITGGSGGGSPTVDITLAETGWAVDGRNRNDWDDDDLAAGDQKQVTFVGDATGFTNKPYIHFATGQTTSGLNTRHWMEVWGSTAHNSALGIDAQPGIGPGYVNDGASYCIFPQNQVASPPTIDFWFSADEFRVHAHFNNNPTATTDDGLYGWLHVGFMDRLKTETEDPYPMIQGAHCRDRDALHTAASTSITSLAECRAPTSGPVWYYTADTSSWASISNDTTGSVGAKTNIMFPFGEIPTQTSISSPEYIVADSVIMLNDGVIQRDRNSSTRVLRPTPGTTDLHFLFPLIAIRKLLTTVDPVTDSVRAQVRGVYWVYNDDGAGAAITNFSEDYITIGTDRYRIFHNHDLTTRYQYVAVLEDV